ncbi:MAG: ectonucleotide pyrophosphatase/phosphodiesterase, partial [Acidobacteriota bacterium]
MDEQRDASLEKRVERLEARVQELQQVIRDLKERPVRDPAGTEQPPARPAGLCFVLLLALCLFLLGAGMQPWTAGHTLILISLDGVGWDYPERFEMSHLLRLGSEGVRARALIPVYPTETFPSHYSIVTGLFPEDHGLISNTMYDPEFDAVFRIRNSNAVTDPRWWGGEPIWATAKRQGLVTATYFWPGTDVKIGGMRPDYWYSFDPSVSRQARIEQLFQWLDMPPSSRPSLITQYFGQVDKAGHDFGPEAAQTRRAAAQVDGILGDILRGIEERGVQDEVNLMV